MFYASAKWKTSKLYFHISLPEIMKWKVGTEILAQQKSKSRQNEAIKHAEFWVYENIW